MVEIKKIFKKIGAIVSNQDIQEWVQGENEDVTFATEEGIIDNEDADNQESDEEIPIVKLVRII